MKNEKKSWLAACNTEWLRMNIKYGLLLGLLVGLVLVVGKTAFEGRVPSTRSILFNMLFSTVISICVCNSVILSRRLAKSISGNIFRYILFYYSCSLIGMVVGVEVCYLIISMIFDSPYELFGHPKDLISSCFIMFIVTTIIFIYHSQRENLNAKIREKDLDVVKLNQLKTNAELQALQSKINPHFLYNALNSIAGLIHEDADKAEDMTLKLSKLFRYSINSQQENLTSVAEELEIVNTYLDIERVRFGDRIAFSIESTEHVEKRQIPRFLIQPLVENALKHGLNHKVDGGRLQVSVTEENDTLIVEVADNGAAFPEELQAGYGLQSTYEKLNLLFPEQYDVQLSNDPKKIRISIYNKAITKK